jgi:hypothetical protein
MIPGGEAVRYLDSEINRLIAQTRSPVFHNVLMDLRDLRKLARNAVDLYHDPNVTSDGSIVEKAMGKLKAHLEAKPRSTT